eukprot:TRINITY_DN521_c1_g1_i1.p1 TRINITY_DN521_c1_g1~~TRINITY_DN521_c1_g1_i1.p1  ORF type:complete len:836 (-),score=239.79 TRINITY_DN521_c1_g1_i1:70-2577(-)
MERRALKAGSVSELYECTVKQLPNIDKSTTTKLSIYYKTSRELLAKARLYRMEGDLEGAYEFMLKYILLLHEKFPKHPQYNDLSMQNEVESGKRIVLKVLSDIEVVKKQLEQLYAEEKAAKLQEEERIKNLQIQEREREKSRQTQMEVESNRKKAEEREKQRIDDLKRALEDQDNMIPNQQNNKGFAPQSLDLSFFDPDEQDTPTSPQSTMDLSFLEEHFPTLSTTTTPPPNQPNPENNVSNGDSLLDTDFLANQLSSSSSTKDGPMFSHLAALKGPQSQKTDQKKGNSANQKQNNASSKESNISYPSVMELPPPSKIPTPRTNTYTPSPISNSTSVLPPQPNANFFTSSLPLQSSEFTQEPPPPYVSQPVSETSLLQQLLPQPIPSQTFQPPEYSQQQRPTSLQTSEQVAPPQPTQIPVQQQTEVANTDTPSTESPEENGSNKTTTTSPPPSPVIQHQPSQPIQQLLPQPLQQPSPSLTSHQQQPQQTQQQPQITQHQPAQQQQQVVPAQNPSQPVFAPLPPSVHRTPFYQTPQFIPPGYATAPFVHPSQAAAFKPPYSLLPSYQTPVMAAGFQAQPNGVPRPSSVPPPNTNSAPAYAKNNSSIPNNSNSNANGNHVHHSNNVKASVPTKSTPVNDVPSVPMIGAAVQSNPSTNSSKLRKLILYAEMFSSFMQAAASNTNRRIETCGVLSGILEGDVFTVNTLIIPKQEGTSDTCGTTDEAELFEYQFGNDLLTLGWIHTHPTQDCFLSSVDLHTHASYQYLLSEAVAVVMAPARTPNFGIFRLSDPPGLQLVQSCKLKGFHPHTRPDGGILYTLCPHFELIWGKKNYKVVDMR